MSISYLLSILDLYTMKEKNSSLIIEVLNNEDLVKVNFCYTNDTFNKTFVKVSKDVFFTNLKFIMEKIEPNLEVLNESLFNNNLDLNYEVIFKNKRKISFLKFNKEEIQKIQANLNIIKESSEDEKVISFYDEQLNKNKNISVKLSLSMGFSNYMILFISAIWFLDILMIALLVFKLFIK